MNFDEFIKMCDSLVRRGKRIFEKGTVSDILRNVQSSYVLYDALVYAVEHCFKHAAMHAPAKYAALLAALNNLEKIKTKDITSFLGASTNVPSAMISQTFVVVDADQAMLTAMQFWEIEYQCQNKLIATARARFTIGAFIHRWLYNGTLVMDWFFGFYWSKYWGYYFKYDGCHAYKTFIKFLKNVKAHLSFFEQLYYAVLGCCPIAYTYH